MADDEISEEGRKTRFAQWEKYGADRLKSDLQTDPYRRVGSGAVQNLAWEFVRMKEEENELAKIAQTAPAAKTENQYSMDAARAVYSAIQSLIAGGKPPNSHSVPRVAENILVQSGGGTISRSDAGDQVKTAIIELAGAGKIEAHLEPYKDWLIKESLEMATLNNKIFVVHGHDEGAREAVARFLEKIEFIPIILQEQPNQGRTII
jgi:hypothetical protein